MIYLTGPLNSAHRKEHFLCGKELLDHYLHKQASQDVKRKLAACFILTNEKNQVKGYYTLSNGSVPAKQIPEAIKKKMPAAYTNLPITLLGRLAVDSRYKGLGIGKLLLIDALKRSYDISSDVASMAIIVDPLDKEAELFYENFGFIKLTSGKMFLPKKSVASLFV
jgi:GNAT superfamily N-acetyltransferase